MKKKFKKTVSSGGVIVKLINNRPHILVLVTKHENKGFLPKGHVEKGETLEEAVLREIYEEAGIKHLEIIEKIGIYERRVDTEDIKEDKTIHYYLMIPTIENENHSPLEDSSNIEFNWYSIDDLPEMYLDENRDVIEKNREKIKNHFFG